VVHVGSQPTAAPSKLWQQWAVPHALVVDATAQLPEEGTTPAGWHHSQAVRGAEDKDSAVFHTASLQAESGLSPPLHLRHLWPSI
jgi:hypothetical protein